MKKIIVWLNDSIVIGFFKRWFVFLILILIFMLGRCSKAEAFNLNKLAEFHKPSHIPVETTKSHDIQTIQEDTVPFIKEEQDISSRDVDVPIMEIVADPFQIKYPLHSTPESLSSFSLGYTFQNEKEIVYAILRLQFHAGQYRFLEKLWPTSKKILVLKPRVAFNLLSTTSTLR